MSSEHEPLLSEQEAELAPLLRDALRGRTPPGRTSAQHDALERELQAGARPRSLRVRALQVALACALPVALVVGWQAHTASERLSAEQERDATRAVEAQLRQRREEEWRAAEAARLAEKAAETERKHAAERRAVEEATRAVRAASAAAESSQAGAAKERPALPCTSADRRSAKRGARPAGSCPPAASKSAGGGCDPNDPLCGL